MGRIFGYIERDDGRPATEAIRGSGSHTRCGLDPLIGTVVANHYRIEIGIAGRWLRRDLSGARPAQRSRRRLKLLHPNLTQDPAVLARFRREGGALSQLHDRHTVTAYEVGETADGTLYIAMELLQGMNLFETFDALGPCRGRRVATIRACGV